MACSLTILLRLIFFFFFFSSRRRHTRLQGDWSSDVCSSDLSDALGAEGQGDLSPQSGRRVGGAESLLHHASGFAVRDRRLLTAHAPREVRSEERRVGKECRSRWSPYH